MRLLLDRLDIEESRRALDLPSQEKVRPRLMPGVILRRSLCRLGSGD